MRIVGGIEKTKYQAIGRGLCCDGRVIRAHAGIHLDVIPLVAGRPVVGVRIDDVARVVRDRSGEDCLSDGWLKPVEHGVAAGAVVAVDGDSISRARDRLEAYAAPHVAGDIII